MSKDTRDTSTPNLAAILAKAGETKLTLEAELNSLKRDLGVGDNNIAILELSRKLAALAATPNPEAALDEAMKSSLAELNKVSTAAAELETNHNKTPEEAQELLKNLARGQDIFCISMKMVQIAQVQLVIDHCEVMQNEQDQTKIPRYASSLKANLDRIDAMPSTSQFENQNSEISRLVGIHALATTLVKPALDSDGKPSKTSAAHDSIKAVDSMAGQISKAFRENLQKFSNFISRSPQAAENSNPSNTISQISQTARDEIVKYSNRLENDQSGDQARIAADQAALKAKLEVAEKTLEEKKKPKPFFKKFLTAITGGRYKGGAKEDVREDERRVSKLKEYISHNEKLSNLGQQKYDAEILIENFDEFKNTVLTPREEVNLKNFTKLARSYVEAKQIDKVVIQAISEQNLAFEQKSAQESSFSDLITKSFQASFYKANLIKDGEVIAKATTADNAIFLAQSVVSQISIPGVQQGLNGFLAIAQYANQSKQAAANQNVADFAKLDKKGNTQIQATAEDESLRDQIVGKIAKNLYELYSVKTDGASPLDNLSEKGVKKFAGAIVEQVVEQISNFRLPPKTEFPRLNKEEIVNSQAYRDGILANYGVDLNEYANNPKSLNNSSYKGNEKDGTIGKANEIERLMYVEFMAKQLTNLAIQGQNQGKASVKIVGLVGKIQFESDDLANPEESRKFNVQGLIKKVGIVTEDGRRFVSDARAKDLTHFDGETKYGFRKATEDEEKLARNGAIAGYKLAGAALTPKESFLKFLAPEDFKNGQDYENRAQLVERFLQDFSKAKTKDQNLELRDFLKKDGLIANIGSATFGIKDTARLRFDAIAGELKEVVDSEAKTPVIPAVINLVTDKVPQKIDSRKRPIFVERTAEELAKLEQFSEIYERKHFDTNVVKARSTNVVDTVSADLYATFAVASDAISKFLPKSKSSESEDFSDQAEQLAQSFKKQAAALKAKNSSAATNFESKALAIQQFENDSNSKNDAYENDKKELVNILKIHSDFLKPQTLEPFLKLKPPSKNPEAAALTDFVEKYHAKVMDGASKDDLLNFAANNSPVNDQHPEVKAMASDLAISYSEALIAKMLSRKTVAQAAVAMVGEIKKDLTPQQQKAQDTFDEATKKAAALLKNSDLKKPKNIDGAEIAQDILESYSSWKKKNPKADAKAFFKSDESPIDNGQKPKNIFGFGKADPERIHFNKELKSPLLELLKSFDKMSELGIAPKFEKPVEARKEVRHENIVSKILQEGPHHVAQYSDHERGA